MPEPQVLVISATWTSIFAILVLYLGRILTSRIGILRDFNIPDAVARRSCLKILVIAQRNPQQNQRAPADQAPFHNALDREQ